MGNWVLRQQKLAMFRSLKVHARIKKAQSYMHGMFPILQEQEAKQTKLRRQSNGKWRKKERMAGTSFDHDEKRNGETYTKWKRNKHGQARLIVLVLALLFEMGRVKRTCHLGHSPKHQGCGGWPDGRHESADSLLCAGRGVSCQHPFHRPLPCPIKEYGHRNDRVVKKLAQQRAALILRGRGIGMVRQGRWPRN
jgi:hypothetical protein